MEIVAYLVGAVIGLLCCVPVFIVYGVAFVLEGIAFTKLAQRKPVKCLWIAWVPFYVEYSSKKYLMLQMSDEPDFRLFGGKMVFKNKMTPFWIYLAGYCGCILISACSALLGWIPIVGLIVILLACAIVFPAIIVLAIIDYAYFRDFLHAFSPDRQANVTTAVLVTIGNFFTFGIVRAIYIFCMVKKLEKAPVEEEIY